MSGLGRQCRNFSSVSLLKPEINSLQISIDNQSFTPNRIFCIGKNYGEHIRELGGKTPEEPVVFMKPVPVSWFPAKACLYLAMAISCIMKWKWCFRSAGKGKIFLKRTLYRLLPEFL
jgi:hypothetical protein